MNTGREIERAEKASPRVAQESERGSAELVSAAHARLRWEGDRIAPADLEGLELRCGHRGPPGELIRLLLIAGLVTPHPDGGLEVAA